MAELAASVESLSLQSPAQAKAPFFAKRVELFERYAARTAAELEAARARAEPIAITLPDGSLKAGIKWVTTPLDVAAGISKSLAGSVVVAKVNDAVWDVFRPLEGDCSLKLCTFEDTEGRDVRGSLASSCWDCPSHSPLRLRRRSGTVARTCWARFLSSRTAVI